MLFNCLTAASSWLVGCNSLSACDFRPRTGVPFGYTIRESRFIDRICDRHARRSRQEANLVAAIDRAICNLLRPDDHADCGAGPNHRVAALADSRTVPRQHRTLCGENEGTTGTSKSAVGSDPDPGDPDSIVPKPRSQEPVNPGANSSGPVFPGRTATQCRKFGRDQETAVPDAVQARGRSDRRCPDTDYDLATGFENSVGRGTLLYFHSVSRQ